MWSLSEMFHKVGIKLKLIPDKDKQERRIVTQASVYYAYTEKCKENTGKSEIIGH